jgi:hypothetical protein
MENHSLSGLGLYSSPERGCVHLDKHMFVTFQRYESQPKKIDRKAVYLPDDMFIQRFEL